MIEPVIHIHNHLHTNLTATADQRDPSRTTSLRNAFAAEMTRRFKKIAQLVWKAIVEEDVFGLQTPQVITVQQHTPGYRAFAFTQSSRKVSAFMQWIRQQVRAGILDVRDIDQIGSGVNAAWTNKYVFDSYKRGVARARYQMRNSNDPGLMKIPAFDSGRLIGSLSTPFHLDRLGILYTRVFTELQGITSSMDADISRALAQGIADGLGPREIARNINRAITGGLPGAKVSYINKQGKQVSYVIPGKQRAEILARTEIIRAHAQGQLQEFKNWRVEGVSVEAEFVTAGDDRVCFQCSSYEGNKYTIEEAYHIIPIHPRCRCIWVPLSSSRER